MWRKGCRSILLRKYSNSIFRRLESSSASQNDNVVDINKIPLNQPIPGFPSVSKFSQTSKQNFTEVTSLENGLKVASERGFGKHCTVGVVIDSGSRYEVAFPSGVSHFLEKLAFGSTVNYKTRDAIMTQLEKYGGICDCQIGKDVSLFAISAESRYISDLVGILSDVVWRPVLHSEELDVARNKIRFELEDLYRNPMKEPQLMELVHAAAYRENTLGLPKICPADNIDKIDSSLLHHFMRMHFAPPRMVLAAVGVEHERLLDAARQHFREDSAVWHSSGDLQPAGWSLEVDQSVAQYTGGSSLVEQNLSELVLAPTAMPDLAHIAIGLESCSHQSADFVPTCVLNTLMGGGGSFSAGGPGKGMYSRLYTRVLNRQHWVYNATAFNHSYMDSGVFCIYAASHPDQLRSLCNTVVRELSSMTASLELEELERAKKQLSSMLMMNLETRPVQFEDIGRQVLASGARKRPEFFIDAIARVTSEDLQRVAQNILSSKPSVAALGSLKKMPSLEEVTASFQDNGRSTGRKLFSLLG